jgi:hypothetical protein
MFFDCTYKENHSKTKVYRCIMPNQQIMPKASVSWILAYFPYFEEMKVGLCCLHAVYMFVNPPY